MVKLLIWHYTKPAFSVWVLSSFLSSRVMIESFPVVYCLRKVNWSLLLFLCLQQFADQFIAEVTGSCFRKCCKKVYHPTDNDNFNSSCQISVIFEIQY